MEAKKLREYFLSGSFGLCIGGMVGSILSVLWLILKFRLSAVFVRVHVWELLLLLAGPVLLVLTLKNTIKTTSLLSELKKNRTLADAYHSLTCATEAMKYRQGEVILSERYLFVKDAVAVLPYAQIVHVYSEPVKNDKGQITGVCLSCHTAQKKTVKIFQNVTDRNELVRFVEDLKQKNPYIAVTV